MKSQFGKKFRIISALEKGNILLLNILLTRQNHPADKPVDKLGNNIFHIACSSGNLQMAQYIHATYNLDINLYNTDGMNSIHLAAYGGHLHIIQWLCDLGADCHSTTLYFHRSAYDIVCSMLSKSEPPDGYQSMTPAAKKKLIEIKNFLRSKYFSDCRGREVRKFLWFYQKLKDKNSNIGRLPPAMIQEIGEYF